MRSGGGAGAGQESAATTPGGDTEAWGGEVRGTTGLSVTGHGSLIKQYLVWESPSQAYRYKRIELKDVNVNSEIKDDIKSLKPTARASS